VHYLLQRQHTHLIVGLNTSKSLASQEKSKTQTMKPDSLGGQQKLTQEQQQEIEKQQQNHGNKLFESKTR
jgi:hypothetical protein